MQGIIICVILLFKTQIMSDQKGIVLAGDMYYIVYIQFW